MKKAISIFAALLLSQSITYSTPPPNANELARIEAEKRGHSGFFSHLLEEKYQINVNYSFEPKVPKDKISFVLHTPEPRPLSLAIKDRSGQIVLKWEPKEELYIYRETLNVKNLKKGEYTYVILWDNEPTHEIQFMKE